VIVLDEPKRAATKPQLSEVLIAEALIKEARQRLRRRWLSSVLAALVLLAAGVVLATHLASGRTKSATSTSTGERPGATCLPSQLAVGPFDGAAAAGTGLEAIPVKDTSSLPCSLRGYPIVAFFNISGALLATTVGHSGPGPGFRESSAVELGSGDTADAGFIMTTHDFPTDNETTCPQATFLRVTLPGVERSYQVRIPDLWPGLNLCSPGSPVNIGPIVKVSAFYEYGFARYVHPPGIDYGATSIYGPHQIRG
jgi:hypothetical protein